MKRIAILGSTGSIGQSALSLIEHLPDKFSVVGLTTAGNIDLLEAQIKKFRPRCAAVANSKLCAILKKRISSGTKLIAGQEGVQEIASLKEADVVLVAISGFGALLGLLAAIRIGKQIALANKEALVSAGGLIMSEVRRHGVTLIPVDSEQCAIFQCLAKENQKSVKSIFLTASGGPLYFKHKDLKKVTRKEVLTHPRWSMGPKITVDSANLMNKGLEVIEAKWLFGLPVDKIKVLIHPQATVHSMVEFIDGSILGQLSITDMRLPIQFALSFPERFSSPFPGLDFNKVNRLDFFPAQEERRFPCLSLAYQVARKKPSAGTVLNAANEEAVRAFLDGKLKFFNIPKVIEQVLHSHKPTDTLRLEHIFTIDLWAREKARELIKKEFK